MSNVHSIFEQKHEDTIHLQANYILQLEKTIGDPLKSVTPCLDQVSTFLLVLCLDAWNWMAENTMISPHFV